VLGIFIGGIVIFFMCNNLILTSKNAQIDLLQTQLSNDKRIQTDNIDIKDTKQAIRTFLESVNPAILQMIDEGQKKICAYISDDSQKKLTALYSRPDFAKYLSFESHADEYSGYFNATRPYEQQATFVGKDCVIELNKPEMLSKYYFYPKDALIK
jgi:hypothetical protein